MRWWWIGGAVISLTGAVLLARQAIDEQRALFETDARIVHRLLSQQVVQHDAMLATLAASASYIAVPAAMRLAVPEANPSLSLTASLGITFPFNILVGIPLYVALATALLG